MDARAKAALVSILSNTVLVMAKLVVGILTHSVSIISEAIHSVIDLVAAIIAFFSIKQARKPADDRHRFGHGKIENVSGVVEAFLIFVAAIWIIYEAVGRLVHGGEMTGIGLGVAVMIGAAVSNWLVSAYLLRVAKQYDSIALQADAMHLRTDVYTTIGVVGGLLLIYLTGKQWLDAATAIVVALFIFKAAWDLTREAALPLLDVSLPAEEEAIISEVIKAHAPELVGFHQLRTRKAGSERHVDLHLVVPKGTHVEEVHALINHLHTDIEARFAQTVHILMHVEPCEETCQQCCIVEMCRKTE